MSDDAPRLRIERPAPHVCLLTLDRPEAANALDQQLFAELDAALTGIESDPDIRVWLITGAPRRDGRPWFSAGADLKEALQPETDRAPVDPARVVERIAAMLKPSIAVVPGFCTTGALELILACDLRVAGHAAQLSDWHLKATGLGIGRWGSAARLSRLVGLDKAKELLLTGTVVDGAEALRIGLVNRLETDGELMERSLELASTIAAMPPRGVRTTMGFLALQQDMPLHEALRWAELTPDLMGLELRPFRDAGTRFADRSQALLRPAPGDQPTL